MGDEVTRQECNQSMERIHTRVDEISKCSTEVKVSVKNMENIMTDIHKVMYGNGKDGLVTKVSNLWQKVSGIFWLGGVIVVAVIGTLVGLIFKK